MKYKKWTFAFLICYVALMLIGGITTIIVDPFFHYHAPLKNFHYNLYNERYQNSGIVKHFDYNAIVTGTSMTENFKTTEIDSLWGTKSIKVPFSGGCYAEINDNLELAFHEKKDIRMIIRCLDSEYFYDSYERTYRNEGYPTYLTDDNIWNDVKYIFNKEIFLNDTLEAIRFNICNAESTSFDQYAYWGSAAGEKQVRERYSRNGKYDEKAYLSIEEKQKIELLIEKHVTSLAAKHPETQFYFYYPPYSIFWWDKQSQQQTLEKYLDTEKYITELLLDYDNVHVFSFGEEYDLICNLDNYNDILHYGDKINSQILIWMRNGTHELTLDNYESYYDHVYSFYSNYDYDSMFE